MRERKSNADKRLEAMAHAHQDDNQLIVNQYGAEQQESQVRERTHDEREMILDALRELRDDGG